MRLLSCILMLLGIYLLAVAAYQETHGSTTRPAMYLPFSKRAILDNHHWNSRYQFRIHVLERVSSYTIAHK
jgi:hypothetical protein